MSMSDTLDSGTVGSWQDHIGMWTWLERASEITSDSKSNLAVTSLQEIAHMKYEYIWYHAGFGFIWVSCLIGMCFLKSSEARLVSSSTQSHCSNTSRA